MKREKKEKAPPAKFWSAMVKTFFDFVAEKFQGEQPSFDGSAPRDLKAICGALEKRAEVAGVEWTEETGTKRLRKFLEVGYSVPWLREHFLLSNLNRQKDTIFFTIKQLANGTTHIRGNGEKPNPSVNTSGNFGKL